MVSIVGAALAAPTIYVLTSISVIEVDGYLLFLHAVNRSHIISPIPLILIVTENRNRKFPGLLCDVRENETNLRP